MKSLFLLVSSLFALVVSVGCVSYLTVDNEHGCIIYDVQLPINDTSVNCSVTQGDTASTATAYENTPEAPKGITGINKVSAKTGLTPYDKDPLTPVIDPVSGQSLEWKTDSSFTK